ncbi:MAG: DNA mismatch repair protein MutL, partial [Microcoleus sp. SIO2G3]|nr:DNA mismatch repair protein MutL [Microcoleus sp. SIO2G3]
MASIQPLPSEVIHLIAAGEVIDSLAAVVRELSENALDAGATRISIALWPEQWRVRVSDNGCGMSLADLKQAATAHSTSKISSSQDLWRIHSLGFRGEALHSLAQLGDLEVCSRASDEPDGYQVSYDHQGQVDAIAPIAIAVGSIVTVSNLFATLPTRRQGVLPAQQWRSVQTMIQNLALCHPQVTWQIEQNDRPWLSL